MAESPHPPDFKISVTATISSGPTKLPLWTPRPAAIGSVRWRFPTLPAIEYPGLEVRKVQSNGWFSYRAREFRVIEALCWLAGRFAPAGGGRFGRKVNTYLCPGWSASLRWRTSFPQLIAFRQTMGVGIEMLGGELKKF